jgi:uncharacterized protein (DUF934 family)
MQALIKDGKSATCDRWAPVQAEAEQAPAGHIATLSQWQALTDKRDSAVQIEPGEGIEPLLEHLDALELVAVSFPVFTDGRGFSYGRELRERGYRGELRAVGHFLPDQVYYLRRCGFDAFQFADESRLEEGLRQYQVFSDAYQASIDQPLPLFRRRA